MEGLAYNAIGVSRLTWDAPQRARRYFSRACDLFEQAGVEHEANLGLALMNLAVTQGALGNARLEAELLIQAGELLVRAQAWSFWSGVINLRAQRLAAAGDVETARALFGQAATLDLPNDSVQRLAFGQAKVEAKYGDAHAAQQALVVLEPWARVRQDFLDTYLETRATAQARSGDAVAAYATLSELLEIIRGLHAHERTVQLRAQEQQPYRDRSAALEVLTRQDALTGLSNRRDVQERAAELLARGWPLVVALIDVDNFKQVNDVHGHAAGDAVLIALATLIRREVGEQDVVARLGGDEFLVLCASDDLQGFHQVMHGVCEASAAQRMGQESHEVQVTLSIGVTRVQTTLAAALAQADQAMYQAKRQGRNSVQLLTGAELI